MKHTLAALALVFMMNVNAQEQKKAVQPSESEVAQNRACFQDLEVQGCGKWEDDQEHFRSCMSNVHMNLDDHCKKMMSKLYGSH